MRSVRVVLLACAFSLVLTGGKFYPDDPLMREPEPLHIEAAKPRKISDVYDLFWHLFSTPGEPMSATEPTPALDVNTIGEVMDGAWYEKRHARRRMSIPELMAGPGASTPPAEGPWRVIAAKTEGVTPGFLIEDVEGRRYFLKFDPLRYPELATSADVIGSKLFYALGYHTPENYIVHFDKSRLELRTGVKHRDRHGRILEFTPRDLSEILLKAPVSPDGRLRASASMLVPGRVLGPFRYFGTRRDDPNDVIPHEHRRSLRGLHVFAAWVDHDDSRAINTLDSLVTTDGRSWIKHFLLDFGSIFGSASNAPNSPRSGFEPLFTWKNAAKEFFTFGAWIPNWSTIEYPEYASVGRFSADFFDPVTWTPEYPNPAFLRRTPADTFWAAEQVMSFTDEDVRALVRTGQYSDPAAEKYVADTLITRRNAIGRAYLSRPLSLSRFQIANGTVIFDNLAVQHGFQKSPPEYVFSWSDFDNETGKTAQIPQAGSASVPSAPGSRFLALSITARNQAGRIAVYLRRNGTGFEIVGIEREFNA